MTIAGGTAQLGGTGGDQLYDGSTVTVTSGAFDLNDRNETVSTLNLAGTGIGSAGALVNTGTGTAVLTVTSGITLTANASIGATTSNGRVQLVNAIGGAFALAKVGNGTLDLGGASTYSGGTSLNAGTTLVNASSTGTPGSPTNGAFGTGTVTLNGGAIRAGSTGGTRTVGNTVTLSADTTIASSGVAANDQALTFTGPMTISGASRALTSNSGADTTFGGAIGGAAGLGLTFNATSTGKFILSGTNTFTGATAISGGTLTAGAAGALGATSGITVNSGGTLLLG